MLTTNARQLLFIAVTFIIFQVTLLTLRRPAVSTFPANGECQVSQPSPVLQPSPVPQPSPLVDSVSEVGLIPGVESSSRATADEESKPDGAADAVSGPQNEDGDDVATDDVIPLPSDTSDAEAAEPQEVTANDTKPVRQTTTRVGNRVGVCITGQAGRLELESKRQHLIAALRRRFRRIDVVFVMNDPPPQANTAAPLAPPPVAPPPLAPPPVQSSVHSLNQAAPAISLTRRVHSGAVRRVAAAEILPPLPSLPTTENKTAVGLSPVFHTPEFAWRWVTTVGHRPPLWNTVYRSSPAVSGTEFANFVSPFVRPSPYREMNLTAVMSDVVDSVRVVQFKPSRTLLVHGGYVSRLLAIGPKAGRSAARARSHIVQWAMLHECYDAFTDIENTPVPGRSDTPPSADGGPPTPALFDAYVRVRDDGFFVQEPDLDKVFVPGAISVPQCDSYRGLNDKVSFFDRRAANVALTAPLMNYYMHFHQLVSANTREINAEQMMRRVYRARGLGINFLPASAAAVVPARYYADRGWCLKVITASCFGATTKGLVSNRTDMLPLRAREAMLKYNCWDVGTPPDPYLLASVLPLNSTISLPGSK
eukprot:TRINITY_DN8955_c0_g1_i1.p1 TRINITY_DN8955_c0_g1~~TRINITY_DN8955_c0_g1_i1.p1  ORF type:complete len:592 (+),score=67.78 TRINITY_DN8955_c0_g1_i1:176-1951(+)